MDHHVLARSRPARNVGDKAGDVLCSVGKLPIGDGQWMESHSSSLRSVGERGYPKLGEFVILQEADEAIGPELLPEPIEVNPKVSFPGTGSRVSLYLPGGEREADLAHPRR